LEASALHAPTFLARRALAGPRLRLRSDDQLVALFRMGYDDAFAAIHERYRARLFTYTRQMLGGARSDAEDVLQDTFLRAYSALRQDERPVTLRAWLYRVAHNRCVDHLRRPLPAASEVFDVSRPPVLDPPSETERREDLRRLVSDMRRLPEQQRSALLMRELEGLSYTELADALGATVPAVKSLLVRARLSLVEAGEARDAACAEIRAELSLAFDRGVRMSGRSRKHMRDCAGCRGYRHALRGVHEGIGALNPGHGALAAIAKLLGLGSAGSGAATLGGGATVGGGAAGGTLAGASALGGGALAAKVAAIVSCAAVVGTGAAVEIRHHVVTADTGGTAASALKADAKRDARRAPADTRRARKHRAHRARAVRPVTRAQAAPVQAPAVGGALPAATYDSFFPRTIIVTPHAPAPPMTLPGPPEATGGLLAPETSTAAPAAPSVSAAAATASPSAPAASHAPAASLAPAASHSPAASHAPATDPSETSAAPTDTVPATTAPETTSLAPADPPAADRVPPADEPVVGISSEPDPAPADPAPAAPSDPSPLEVPAEPDPGTAPPAVP
jgi:RNA polymerase sigma factor (sigma-70 family)